MALGSPALRWIRGLALAGACLAGFPGRAVATTTPRGPSAPDAHPRLMAPPPGFGAEGPERAGGGGPPDAAAFDRALARAGAWLDTLPVDSDTLRAHGVKGKKKLAEILDADLARWRAEPDPAMRARILTRVRALAAQTRRASYHDMRSCSERELREDGMSYLRVAWLLERFGLDTSAYRDSIAAALPRFVAALPTRGPWQRREFRRYFVAFGLARERARDCAPVSGGVIARRVAAADFDLDRAYDLTHEVFVRTEDPAGAPARWSPGERAYLARVMPDLVTRAFAHGDPDIGAELLTAMAECGLRHPPAFAGGLGALLAAQNPDGTWGRYERDRLRWGGWVEQREYLHTTMVALEALAEAGRGRRPAPAR